MTAPYCSGRFAPTPSGDLHIGSLVAAVASAAHLRSLKGTHRLRIDDIDPPRIVAGSELRILQAVSDFGIPVDAPVVNQSDRYGHYQDALMNLITVDRVFACYCSRRDLSEGVACVSNCQRHRLDNEKPITAWLSELQGKAAIRLDTSDLSGFTVDDAIQNPVTVDDASTLGHPVIWRKDGLVSYLLATSVDDSDGISHVVRGADLWPGTAAQQTVTQLLQRPLAQWLHVPCAVDEHGQKLGKQTRAPSIHSADPLTLLQQVWRFLGQHSFACGSLEEFWDLCPEHWCLTAVPTTTTQRID